jgi:hypothetical protein
MVLLSFNGKEFHLTPCIAEATQVGWLFDPTWSHIGAK